MEGGNRSKRRELVGAASWHLVAGVALLHPEEAVFEAMLEGWAAQMKSRALSAGTIEDRLRMVRRFAEFTNDYPWNWAPADLEDWSAALRSRDKPVAHTTLRHYQNSIAMFLDYLTDCRYGWGDECERRFGFGTFPVQICHEWNMVAHRDGYEGSPEVRPFSRKELQDFFDFCDEKVAAARRLGRKGWVAAFRDATIFKVLYGWGLRRSEAVKLDLVDFGPNAVAPEFGDYGMLSVRWGKSMAGSPPRRRNVLTVWEWAVDVVEEYVEEIRPLYGYGDGDGGGLQGRSGGQDQRRRTLQRAMWATERGGRVSADYLTMRFASYREEIGLPEELHPHSLRHSYITHLIEDGFDPYFVQQQVGHRWGSTTALYTGVSSEFKNHLLRKALDGIYGKAVTGDVNGSAGGRPEGETGRYAKDNGRRVR